MGKPGIFSAASDIVIVIKILFERLKRSRELFRIYFTKKRKAPDGPPGITYDANKVHAKNQDTKHSIISSIDFYLYMRHTLRK